MSKLRKPGTPPTGGKEVLEAWGIIQRQDKTPDAYKRLLELIEECPKIDRHKIGGMIEAFIAYGGQMR